MKLTMTTRQRRGKEHRIPRSAMAMAAVADADGFA